MQTSESITKIIPAIIKVMGEVKSVEKNLTVGTVGRGGYKGVADKDVKIEIGQSMQKHGLSIITSDIQPTKTLSEWDQEEKQQDYQTKEWTTVIKHKSQVFTEVLTTYTIFHESGEWIEVKGYGHGVDSQDKSAGKATTYALKYALLNTFLVPTGDIDDTDTTHSNNIAQKPSTAKITSKVTGLTMPCKIHGVKMEEVKFNSGTYFAHKVDGGWCFGKAK